MKPLSIVRSALIAGVFCSAGLGGPSNLGTFVVSNDDVPALPPAKQPPQQGFNSATFYTVNANGTLSYKTTVPTGGDGAAGGFFAAARVLVIPNSKGACVYVSDAGTGDIAGIDATKYTVTGNFFGSMKDGGTSNGIGLAANAQYLYATYTDSSTIGTFQVQGGCTLNFLGDVSTVGLNGGVVGGMAIQGNMMVITYGDGTIESFNISSGLPVSNGDKQFSTGSADDYLPNGVVITHNGHYAIFGDASTTTVVEVSDISSGKLAPTVAYGLGSAWNSGNVRLSPDETTIFVSNSSSGQVTAAPFNNTTGKVLPGCSSQSLKGFYTNFNYAGNIALQLATGTGGLLYVAEGGGGGNSFLGILQYAVKGVGNATSCTLTESANSPLTDPAFRAFVLSIASYPAAQ